MSQSESGIIRKTIAGGLLCLALFGSHALANPTPSQTCPEHTVCQKAADKSVTTIVEVDGKTGIMFQGKFLELAPSSERHKGEAGDFMRKFYIDGAHLLKPGDKIHLITSGPTTRQTTHWIKVKADS